MAKNKALEIKYRLRELKGVLEYPDAQIADSLKKIINQEAESVGRKDTNEEQPEQKIS